MAGPVGGAVQRLVRAFAPDLNATAIEVVGEGEDHIAFLVDGELIVRRSKERDARTSP